MTAPVDTPAIQAEGLVKRFGSGLTAVDGVSLEVPAGEVFGLVGQDGAGKSTLIRMMATVLRPTEGDALVFGESVSRRPAHVKPRVGYMSQHFSLYGDLTVAENLRFFADLRGVPREELRGRTDRLLEFSDLARFADRQAQYLSGGMKQKLALAATLIHEPDLLFLDEPTTGVDPVSRRDFWRIIAQLHRRGITVFVATPYMDEAERCTTVAFMDYGRILLHDTPAGLKSRVPGRLIELSTSAPRTSVEIAHGIDGVLSASVTGDVVRVLSDADQGPDVDTLTAAVTAAGVEVTRGAYGRVDMEDTFAYLAEEARGRAIESDTEPDVAGFDEAVSDA